MVEFLEAELHIEKGVTGVCTAREHGFSEGEYKGLNLGLHVGDSSENVLRNRELVRQGLIGASQISWLNQIHSNKVVTIQNEQDVLAVQDADAQVTDLKGVALAIMTADCLPVLLTAQDGSVVGAAHCGWRGLLNGVLAKTIKEMNLPSSKVNAWLGPCIGPCDYEVGNDMVKAFTDLNSNYAKCFESTREGHSLANLQGLAKIELQELGVTNIEGCSLSTFSTPEYFYSYRRSAVTGRMASLIWRSEK